MSILIKNAKILTQNNKREIITGNILIENDKIIEISKKSINTETDYKIECRNKLILPGLVNTHTHIPMTLLRGYSDDMVLNKWLKESIWPIESKLDKKSIEIGSKLGILEMIASGTTTFLDMYFFEDIVGKVSIKIGIRTFLGYAMIDNGTPEYPSNDELIINCEKFVKRWANNDLIKPVISPHAVYTCGSELLKKSYDISKKFNTLIHTHCSETRDEVYESEKKYGLRPVKLLEKYNLLNNKMILAHCGWITKNEIQVIKKYDAKVSHCPISNMKIGTGGYAPIPEMINNNITVSLGTDGAASNNTLDMFETMKFCSLIHKQHRWDPEILPAQKVLDFSTIQGAKALKMDKYLGSIEVGKKADIIVIDLNKPHLTPKHDYISHIVYAAKGSDVDTTIINGKPIMLEKNFIELDEQKIIDDAELCAKNLTSKS
jgi:5-methylthioadenosine/S-adenosylhomocysteine deaminase